jgi:hypothetical protein
MNGKTKTGLTFATTFLAGVLCAFLLFSSFSPAMFTASQNVVWIGKVDVVVERDGEIIYTFTDYNIFSTYGATCVRDLCNAR